jgi:hypothetical protein
MSADDSPFHGCDFSIVVQGPILSSPEAKGSRDITIRCVASIRRFFPGAEIILSTWEGADTDGLDYDVLVKSADPGAIVFSETMDPPVYNNMNRQIVSSRAGLEKASRPFAVKFRGDLFFVSDELLRNADGLREPLTRGLFRSRVIISPYLTINPRQFPIPFHFSDIVQVGRTDDLRDFWSIPPAPEPEFTRWHANRKSSLFRPVREHYKVRVAVEQYLNLEQLARCGRGLFLDHPHSFTPSVLALSERTLVESYRVLDPAQLGVTFPARLSERLPPRELYQGADWDRLSRAYRHPWSRRRAQASLIVGTYYRLVVYGIWWVFFRGLPRVLRGGPSS